MPPRRRARPDARPRGARYTPVSKRQDKPDAIEWILRTYPEVQDAQIGRLLGRSRQAVRQRFGDIDGTAQPLPLGPRNDEERVMAYWYESTACTRRRREFLDIDPSDTVPW